MAVAPVVAAIAGAASTGAQVAGSIAKGNAQKRAAEREAELKRQQADEVIRRSKQNVLALKRQRRTVKGRQISGFAKAGVELAGSTLEVLNSTEMEFERDILNTRRDAEFKASQLRAGADIAIEEGKAAKTAGLIGGIAGGVTGIGGLASDLDLPGGADEFETGIQDLDEFDPLVVKG